MVDILAAPQQSRTDASLRTLAAISVAIQAAHVHRVRFRPVAARAPTEGLDATRLAESVVNDVLVELIDGELVLTAENDFDQDGLALMDTMRSGAASSMRVSGFTV